MLITFDDLRYDTPRFNGGPARTPNMDRLAAEGVNFRRAMATVGLYDLANDPDEMVNRIDAI